MSHHPIHILARSLCLFVAALVIAAGVTAASAQDRPEADPAIAALMAQVQSATLIDYVNQLTGETPVLVGGAPYTFVTRDTESGEPIDKATQFAYEFMQARNLPVDYHAWRRCGIENRNVVAEKVGVERPDEIVLVTAHIDSISYQGAAPGADDDASGSAGVMMIAEILAPVQTERTLRFVLFTGEEQGLCGSAAYARAADDADEDIVAVYNMDMIAWDSDDEPIVRLHTRRTNDAGYVADLAIANTFIAVVADYGLGSALSPRILADGLDEADTYSFWEYDFPGILAIEDDGEDTGDFNPSYHSSRDKVAAFNQEYFTNFVKASTGTVAALAGIVHAPVSPHKLNLPIIRRQANAEGVRCPATPCW